MKLKVGLEYQKKYRVKKNKTVPELYPESNEFIQMPSVFATGFLVGLLEWACIEAINPYINWPVEQTLGVHIDISHEKANKPNDDIMIDVKLTKIEGRRLFFDVKAYDKEGIISRGTHQRHLINKANFDKKLNDKTKS